MPGYKPQPPPTSQKKPQAPPPPPPRSCEREPDPPVMSGELIQNAAETLRLPDAEAVQTMIGVVMGQLEERAATMRNIVNVDAHRHAWDQTWVELNRVNDILKARASLIVSLGKDVDP